MVQEGLWEVSRLRRTFLMALDMLVVPLGAVVLGAALLPWVGLPFDARLVDAGVGAGLLAVGLVTWQLLLRQGRRVGAVYGLKGARRAGLLPPQEPPRP